MRRAALLALTIAASIASPMRVEAKAYFMGLPAAVAAADAVAVVQVETSEKVTGQKKGYWTYGQRNTFRFLELVKRAPFIEPVIKERQILWGEKDFVCASESFRPGLYLMFLESIEPGEWVSVNHYMGVLPIEQNTVGWPYEKIGAIRTVDQAKDAVARAKATHGSVRFTAEIVGSFDGLYNRWIPSRSHQVLVFHLHGKAPSPWPADDSFARAVIPRDVVNREAYEAWVGTDGLLSVRADWVDGSLVIREAQRVSAK